MSENRVRYVSNKKQVARINVVKAVSIFVHITLVLVMLAYKAAEIFDRSTTNEKRQLMGYLFSNLELEGSKLRYALKTPFNLFINLDGYKEWLPGSDSNQRQDD